MKIFSIVGARPNFMKVAPIHRAIGMYGDMESKIIHTGQHFDQQMSGIFFEQLELPVPAYYLGVGGGSHTFQTATIMLAFERVIQVECPDLVLVVGDVNSTLACALVAAKAHIPVVHVEAGLRSGDKKMPEELNRIMTDAVSDQLFVTEQSAVENLRNENIPEQKIHFAGNVMIDSLRWYQPQAAKLNLLNTLSLPSGSYVLMTMHRPSNVDTDEGLRKMLMLIKRVSLLKKVVFPIHPRTLKNMENAGLRNELESLAALTLLPPQGYLEFLNLLENAYLVITDSGGIQEETTFLQVPCITFRNSTERPVTVEVGTNHLISTLEPDSVLALMEQMENGNVKKGAIPALWDGKAAERIVGIIRNKYMTNIPARQLPDGGVATILSVQ